MNVLIIGGVAAGTKVAAKLKREDPAARVTILTALATLKIGMDILVAEGVKMDSMLGHGGLYKTPVVGQRLTAAAINAPVSVMKTAGEGGAWGIAVLASYMANRAPGETLDDYLNNRVFAGMSAETLQPDDAISQGFDAFLQRYTACLDAEKACVKGMKG